MSSARHDFIPRSDGGMRQWAENFAGLLVADHARYGLDAGEATDVHSVVAAYAAALARAREPATRNVTTVAEKDARRAVMLDVLRSTARFIRINHGVSNADKAALGLTIADQTRTPVPAPVTAPRLAVVAATPLVHTLRYADANAPDRRGKPPGAIGLQLFVRVTRTVAGNADAEPEEVNVAGPESADFRAFVTRQPLGVEFKPSERGLTAHYYARWQTRRGLVGPWSAKEVMVIA
jgi:hypothetical protein